MSFSKTETAIEESERLFANYDLSASPIEGYLAQYILIVLCADMQQAVYSCINSYLDDNIENPHIKEYMRGSLIRLFRSIEKPEIAKILGYFGETTKTVFNQKLENLDEEVANLNYVANKAEKTKVDIALTNSFGFGGHNAVLIYKKYN